jgi:excisionase family DNA binding protein
MLNAFANDNEFLGLKFEGRDAASTSEPSIVPMSKDPPRLLCTVTDAGGVLSLSRSKVYELINAGLLPAIHIGRSIRIRVSDLEKFVDHQTPDFSFEN